MEKEEEIYKGIYNFVKENPDMVATELSAIVHMANIISKEEIVARCVAIRNALWDLEKEKRFIFKAESEIRQKEAKLKECSANYNN